jgi:hypothetical protein
MLSLAVWAKKSSRPSAPLTRKYELEDSIVEASVLNKAALEAGFSQLTDAMVHRIAGVRTIPRSKEDLLTELASVPIILENVARSQTRLRRSKNGQTLEEEQIIGSGWTRSIWLFRSTAPL